MSEEKGQYHTTNQVGNGNAGRDIHNSEKGPGTFRMPEVLKDELALKAEALLSRIQSLGNIGRVLEKDIEDYQAGHLSANELQDTLEYAHRKLNAR